MPETPMDDMSNTELATWALDAISRLTDETDTLRVALLANDIVDAILDGCDGIYSFRARIGGAWKSYTDCLAAGYARHWSPRGAAQSPSGVKPGAPIYRSTIR